MPEKIFFQSSLPRSGSTMLQNILGQNPKFYVTPTSGVLELIFAARGNYTDSLEFKAQDSKLMKDGFLNFCNKGMHGFYDAITDKPYVIDKSRGWGIYRGFLESFYPDPKIICVVRDLRSIVSSYEKIYRKNQHKSDPIRNDFTSQGTTVFKRVEQWLNPIETIGRSIERLHEIFVQGYGDKILFIKYEDLCSSPHDILKEIYNYLEVEFFNHDFENIEQITFEDDEVYGLSNDLHVIRKKLSIDKTDYHNILGNDICEWIEKSYQWYFNTFNYGK